MLDEAIVNVRYLVDDVAAAVDFYTSKFGFTVGTNAYCVNGSWYTPDQVMKSGVSAQDITNNM